MFAEVTFSAVSTECVSIAILDDTLIEGSEQFTVAIVGSGFAQVLNQVTTITIIDDECES